MSDDFCRAVRQAMPDIAQSVVTAMEDELADCRARLAEVEAERDRLRGVNTELAEVLGALLSIHRAHHNNPVHVSARAALAQTTEKDHD